MRAHICARGEIMEKESNKRSECVLCAEGRDGGQGAEREEENGSVCVCVWEGKTVQQRERAIGA